MAEPRHGPERAARRIALAVTLLLATAGLWQLGAGLWIHGKAWAAQILISRAWAEARDRGVAPPPWPWADTRPVARLTVPSLGIDEIVLAGASGESLAFGPGHLDGTAPPGEPGLAVISGHRDTHFGFLQDLRPGALIGIERADGSRRDYRVSATRVVDSRVARIADPPAGRPRLLLTTCYPFDAPAPGGPLRYVVLADAVAGPY